MATTTTRGLLAALRRLRSIDDNMIVRELTLLLEIANRPDCTLVELGASTGISAPSMSRFVASLGQYGHGLVSATEDRENRRLKRVRLTPKGEGLVAALLNDLKEG